MYHVYQNQAAAAYSFLYFLIFLPLQISTLKFFITLFSGTVWSRRLKLGTHVDRCILYTRIRLLLLLICPFVSSFFFLSNFQTWKFFVTLFSGTVRPRRLKLVTTWTVGSCIMYLRIRLLLLTRSFISSFFFLSNFQHWNFSSLFSGTVKHRRLKIGSYMDSGQMYHVYWNQAAVSYSSLYFFSFFFQISTLKFFITLFSGTVRPRLKLGAQLDNGWLYRGYQNQAAAAYLSLYFLAHLSRRLTRWAYSIPMVRRPSVVVRCLPHFQTWISLKLFDQSWSNFICSITGVGERLHKVLGQIGSKLWFPWQQKATIGL